MTPSPLESADARRFYQRRIALLNRAIFLISSGFLVIGNGLSVIASREFSEHVLTSSNAWHLTSALVACATWLFARGRAMSARALAASDAVSITAQSVAYAGMAFAAEPSPAGRTDMLVMLIMMVLLTLRAVLIPSSPRRTAAIGAVALVPVLAVADHVGGYYEGVLPSPRFFAVENAVLWSLTAIIVSMLTSRVIYGLRREVAAARRLGQYTLEEKIGEGGMGEVYKARHALLRRPTAIKILRRDQAGERTLARFEREVQLTSQLTHPNTIHVYDFGRTPDGTFFYAMEYLDGLSFEELLEMDGPQPASRVIALLVQVCSSLAEAHAIGLIHRDVKPANLVVCERGRIPDFVKVLDFGLVKTMGAAEDALATQADALTGTPTYMAPEAITTPERLDGRVDIYALGAVAYFLLTGRHVFEAQTIVEMCALHLHTKPAKPSSRVSSVPADLEALVLACLAKSPDERPSNAEELRARLLACIDGAAWTAAEGSRWWNENRERIRMRRSRALTAPIGFLTTRLVEPLSDDSASESNPTSEQRTDNQNQ